MNTFIREKYLLVIFFIGIIAVIIFQTNIQKSGNSPEAYVSLGNQMGLEGNHLGASKAFKNSIEIDPYYIPAYLGLGISYGNLQKNKEAIEVLNEGIKLNQVHSYVPEMQMSIANILHKQMNNRIDAIKYVKKALQNFTYQGNYAGVALAGQKLQQLESVF
jgi:tetratricopeptide (TPR) repeat protein